MDTAELKRASGGLGQKTTAGQITLGAPTPEDGPAVHALISACPPLDQNSAYCNALQCTHFAATCVLARRDGAPVGWVSAYLRPDSPETLFVWQVAVAPEARGAGLGLRMLDALLAREACRGVRRLETTITGSNAPSWALFRRLAEGRGAPMRHRPWLMEGAHLPPSAPTEHLVAIGPFPATPS
ncbi:diaminobutyrate acetyltransferase [Phenylobacterium terrae]|uniref:L-2,4-diaminobutyric acid acetyltransferase n=1 Tax=Phenylobacterium terrae TaxID=2665495 RepID=A0ABW4N3N5_9CAUL